MKCRWNVRRVGEGWNKSWTSSNSFSSLLKFLHICFLSVLSFFFLFFCRTDLVLVLQCTWIQCKKQSIISMWFNYLLFDCTLTQVFVRVVNKFPCAAFSCVSASVCLAGPWCTPASWSSRRGPCLHKWKEEFTDSTRKLRVNKTKQNMHNPN